MKFLHVLHVPKIGVHHSVLPALVLLIAVSVPLRCVEGNGPTEQKCTAKLDAHLVDGLWRLYLTVTKGDEKVAYLSKGSFRKDEMDGTEPLAKLLVGKWSEGWGTKDHPSSHLHMEFYEFFADGKVKHLVEDHHLVRGNPDKPKYNIKISDERMGTWKETGKRSCALHMQDRKNGK